MTESRRVVRKLNPERHATFDEQLWPIIASLAVLGVLLVAICVWKLGFGDPLHRNAVTWLTVIAVTFGLMIWTVRHVKKNFIRRAILLSTTLSLIINLVLLVIMAWTHIFFSVSKNEQSIVVEEAPKPTITIPEYAISPFQRDDMPRRAFERPVETGTPDPSQLAVTHHQAEPDAMSGQVESAPAEETLLVDHRHTKPRVAEMESAPRRRNLQSKLSRATSKPPPLAAADAIAVESPAAQGAVARIDPDITSVRQQVAEDPSADARNENQPHHEQVASAANLPRRQTEDSPRQQSTSSPVLPRRLNQPTALPRTDAEQGPGQAVARRTDPETLVPNNTEFQKPFSASIDITPDRQRPPEENARLLARRSVKSEQRAEPSQSMARTSRAVPRKTKPIPAVPSTQDAVAVLPSPTSSDVLSATELQPAASNMQRAASEGTPVTKRSTNVESTLSRLSRVARPPMRNSQDASVPTLRPPQSSEEIPARTRRSADLAASPKALSSPASSQSVRPTENPTALPARTALSKATGGVAGLGSAPNMDRAAPAEPSPTQIASASATRTTSVQRLRDGPAISPSDPAELSRSKAEEIRPGISVKATPLEAPLLAGTTDPSALDVNASAALTQAASNAPTGLVTASKGLTDIDLGLTRIASSHDSGRASGGGQPVINHDTQARMIARTKTGGAPDVTIAVDRMAESAVAPQGTGGGQPIEPRPTPLARSLRRTDPGSDSPISAARVGSPNATSSTPWSGETASATRSGRAEPVEATEARPRAGGGTSSNQRIGRSPPLLVVSRAEEVSIQGADASSGKSDAPPIASPGTRTDKSSRGILGLITPQPTGALAGPEPVEFAGDGPFNRRMSERSSSAEHSKGIVATSEGSNLPSRRSRQISAPLTASADAVVQLPTAPVSTKKGPATQQLVESGAQSGLPRRRNVGALQINQDAPPGPGGFGRQLALESGLLDRTTQAESDQLHPSSARFVRREIGGPVDVAPTVPTIPADAFRRRSQRHGDPEGGGLGQLSPKTEEAIELGLVFLARFQEPDGSWSLTKLARQRPELQSEMASMDSDSAATGLALLSFLGAGYHHKEHKYQETVNNGLESLIRNQSSDGNLFDLDRPESNTAAALYSHAIATISLCEAYGMTQDPRLRQPAQRALDFIVDTQHPERGGWRYTPGRGSDTSVTGWMMMALKSGELANLNVSKEAYEKIEHWLELAQASPSERHLYRYNPFAPDTAQQRHGLRPSTTMTAVGLLMRLYSGWRRDDTNMIKGAQHLLENLPSADSTQRDTYYWYYGTQVMFHMGDKYWETWNNQLHPLLVDSQIKDGPLAGSWDPRQPVQDRWAHHAGRIYVTTMNLLSMEVYYRHLPIYEETAK